LEAGMFKQMTGHWRHKVRLLGGAFEQCEGKVVQVAALKAYGAVDA